MWLFALVFVAVGSYLLGYSAGTTDRTAATRELRALVARLREELDTLKSARAAGRRL